MQNINKNDCITVIIPVYKVEKYLVKCVESIINQTYKNLEILLIDDGSPDNCPTICDELAKKDKRIKVFHRSNEGVSCTRNFGISKSTGDYITFIDSDDTINLETYKKCVKELKDDVDTIFFRMQKVYDDGTIVYNHEIYLEDLEKNKDNIIPFYHRGVPNEDLSNNPNIMGSCCRILFKSSIIKDNNLLFNQNLCWQEDKEFLLKYLLCCKKVKVINEYLYKYYQREGSALNAQTNYKGKEKNHKTLLECEIETLNKNKFLTKKQVKYITQRAAMDYTLDIIFKYLHSNATKQDFRLLYKNKDFKYLLKKGTLFYRGGNNFFTRNKNIMFALVKLKMIPFLKYILKRKNRI